MWSIDPWTGERWAEWPKMGLPEARRAIQRGAAAQRDWARRPVTERAEVLARLATLLRRDQETLAQQITAEMGKVLPEARAEVQKCAGLLELLVREGPAWLEPERSWVDGDLVEVAPRPLGLIFSVLPWNFPLWQALRMAGPALLAGDAVAMKHAPRTQGCAEALVGLAREAGLGDLLQRLPLAEADVAAALACHEVAAVTCTGSDRAGRAVAAAAGAALKPTVLELGGSDPFLVLEDADLDAAAEAGARSRCQNAGQSCVAAKRFIVVQQVAQPFLERLEAEMARWTAGDPRDPSVKMGPLARPDLMTTLQAQVQASLAAGARLVRGGQPAGPAYPATLLRDVPDGCPAATEELFGPVAAVFVEADEEAALRRAQATRFGLGASVWTSDLARGRALASRLRTGQVFLNSPVVSDPRVPFGGVGDSGWGRELGRAGLLQLCNLQTVRGHAS